MKIKKAYLKSNFVIFLLLFIHCRALSNEYPKMISIAQISKFDKLSYPEFCLLASQNNTIFNNFRSHSNYRAIVETTCEKRYGQLFLNEIKTKYSHLLPFLVSICNEDIIGGPIQFNFPEVGNISPNVLRYVRITGELMQEFGDLSQFKIVEIGCGFGGQCKVINNICGFSHYTMIDLPECAALIKKYMSYFDIQNIDIMSCYEINKNIPCDLVISNWAFSEICKEGQLYYMEKIINSAPRGYMYYVYSPGVQPFTFNELVHLLKKQNKKVKVYRNKIITWQP